MTEKYSKKEYINNIEKFTNEHFKSSEDTYDIEYCLGKVYNISDFNYLCECNTINNSIVKIGVKLDTIDNTYKVFYIEFE